MSSRQYYSIRTGRHSGEVCLNLSSLKRMFLGIYTELEDEGWFQEEFGFDCVDRGSIFGALGRDIPGAVFMAIRKDNLWPVPDSIDRYSEDDLFDMLELLYDHVSEPTSRDYHDWNECGWHCSAFDKATGRKGFRERLNRILSEYSDGFELSEDGEVLRLPEDGMQALLDADLPKSSSPRDVHDRVEAAKRKFRRHSATVEDRRDAIRDLADVLEFLRPQVQGVLDEKDETDLFNLANNFGIRHHNSRQKTKYDKAIWLSWAFYYYLATIHASCATVGTKAVVLLDKRDA